jgi:hypothetical protein
MLTKKEAILAKIESPYGTDSSPIAADDAIWASSVELTTDMRELVRNLLSNSLSKPNSLVAPEPISFNLSVELKSHGSADDGDSGAPIEIDPLLRMAGLGVTYSVGTKIEYIPVSSGFESCTIYLYLDGIIVKVLGCRANLEIVMEGGEIAVCNFAVQGLFSIPVDGAIVSPTIDTNKPTRVAGATFTIGSYTPVAKGLQIDMGNVLSSRFDATNANDVREIAITDRDPRGSFEPEVATEAASSFFANLIGHVEAALTFNWGATGDVVKITAPKFQYLQHGWGERENHRIYNTAFKLNENAGDDEFVLEFS